MSNVAAHHVSSRCRTGLGMAIGHAARPPHLSWTWNGRPALLHASARYISKVRLFSLGSQKAILEGKCLTKYHCRATRMMKQQRSHALRADNQSTFQVLHNHLVLVVAASLTCHWEAGGCQCCAAARGQCCLAAGCLSAQGARAAASQTLQDPPSSVGHGVCFD